MNLRMLLGALLVCGLVMPAAAATDPIARVLALPKSSLLVESRGQAVIRHNADRPMVPASTLKVVTALAAIDRWGLAHRFHTDFFLDGGWLWVKGGGDPFLVSEELDLIVAALRRSGIDRLEGIATDDGYFAPTVEVAGRSNTDNPYDAPLSALSANFNTLNVKVSAGGVQSAEPQTPITPLARELARGLKPGKHRINLGKRDLAPRYFAELLGAKLGAAGVKVPAGVWRDGRVPEDARRIYRHENSRDLRELILGMLEFSNNFIANHLFLMMADGGDSGPLTMTAAEQAMAAWVARTFGWRDYRIEEGAGLSRNNRLSARQLLEAVKAFAPYRDLMPSEGVGVLAKTGTLTGVSTLAGFVRRDGGWQPFALMMNQPVDYGLRLQVAQSLTREPDLLAYCRSRSC